MELTDEQIEKALSCCQWALKNCKECPLDPQTPCFTNLHLATLKYIERLKGATESAVQSFTRLDTLYKIKCKEIEDGKVEPKKSEQTVWWWRSNGTDCGAFVGDPMNYIAPNCIVVSGILNNSANDGKPLQPLLKIGDTIYRWLYGSFDEWTISEIKIHIGKQQGALNFTLIAKSESCGMEYFDSDDEGITWFLTKAQAEERVKEYKGE